MPRLPGQDQEKVGEQACVSRFRSDTSWRFKQSSKISCWLLSMRSSSVSLSFRFLLYFVFVLSPFSASNLALQLSKACSHGILEVTTESVFGKGLILLIQRLCPVCIPLVLNGKLNQVVYCNVLSAPMKIKSETNCWQRLWIKNHHPFVYPVSTYEVIQRTSWSQKGTLFWHLQGSIHHGRMPEVGGVKAAVPWLVDVEQCCWLSAG